MGYGVSYCCVECKYVITNPICPDCLTKEMKIVVGEKDPILAQKIDSCKIPGDTQCLSCNQNMGLCAHCFCKDVYEQLTLHDTKIAEDFLAKFDFGIRESFVVSS